jgi:3-dehydroquinate synthase
MKTGSHKFNFGGRFSTVWITEKVPRLEELLRAAGALGAGGSPAPAAASGGGLAAGAGPGLLAVCDANTLGLAETILAGKAAPCVIGSGEAAKTWASVEKILRAAREAGLGRDGLFIGIGGGVVSDLTGFAASVYMRGAGLRLVPTTLLGMADASLGGKTGFDLLGIKNLAGSFYPADFIFMSLESLETLPPREWKSGMAEIIKTAALADQGFFSLAAGLGDFLREPRPAPDGRLLDCLSRTVEVKGRIVEADPEEKGEGRALLNLGHTFGHALESSVGLGTLSHGEAVAWGMARACDLGRALGLTPRERAEAVTGLLGDFGYELRSPHPLMRGTDAFLAALGSDKKRKSGVPRFIIPLKEGAAVVSEESSPVLKGSRGLDLVKRIVNGEIL